MASIGWALLLFLAKFHTLFSTSSAHADADNLTRLSIPLLCNPDHAEALLKLKESFYFGKSTTRLQSWREGTDCCRWEGVGCDTSSGNVTVLDLNNCGLSSYGLDPAIFNLTTLRRLDLSMNYFGPNRKSDTSVWPDNIPLTGFERLAFLTHLNLSNARFQGQVPIGINKLVNLLSLDISTSIKQLSYSPKPMYAYKDNSNNLYVSNFGTLVANLSNLRELYLDGVDLSDTEDWCISLATSVLNLKVLSLAHCGLSGPIHKSLSRLHSLAVINLQLNSYITAGPLPDFFMDFLNLTILQLSDTNLEGWVPSRSFQSTILRVLDLSSNQKLSGHVPNFSSASSLETLRLDGTNFSFTKPEYSTNFKLLKELSIDGDLVSVDFFSSLGRLGSLWKLYLGLNPVSEMGPIFTWIGEHKNLISLELFGYNFAMTTPSSIRSFKTLRRLTMTECNFPGSIISAIGNLVDLQILEMSYCTTYGPIPSSFGNLTSLINFYYIDEYEYDQTGFSGPLPAAIGNLTNLKTMEINGGSISGSIPYTIGQLSKLRWLDLSHCNFSGRIPSSIVNLTQLTKLDLSYNTLNGEVPSSIFTISVLSDLDISSNQFYGPIREFNKTLSHLKTLDLSYNEFSGELPSYIFNIPLLCVLDLSSNQFSGPLQEFNQVLPLEFVDLSENGFSGPIPKAFFQLTSLIHMDLRSNNLIGLVDLAWFWRLRNIITLDLSHNKLFVIDEEGNSPLPSDWSGPQKLGLASCNITQFPRSLMHNKYILDLDLSCNQIIGGVPNRLWETWSSNLISLNLSHNMLTDMQLSSDVLLLTSLDYIDLSFNRFQGKVPMPGPDTIPHLMDYSNNMFSSIPQNFTWYQTFSYLIMSKNIINGHIPYSICNLTPVVLDLSYNNFNGPIPSCLIVDGNLEVLNLRGNHLEGTLASNITTSCMLQTIDLNGNKIEGQLPRALSKCPHLEVLDFGGNRIADSFPSWLRGLPKLSVIVLRSNQFYGSIGDITGDINLKEFFPSLQIIDLASNNFSGNLRPQWFEQLKSMMDDFNSTGRIITAIEGPGGLYQDSIRITYKGSDMIFERILTTLTAIDLSNNRLEGTIPGSIGRLVALRALNLSHNNFRGEIPAELGGMTDLESLDLSCNKLSGKIPQELTNLTFLDVLNLSSNHLVGKVPQSRQFSTFGSNSFEGNVGLCGPPLSELPCAASPYPPCVANIHKSSHHVDVVLFLFVGLGFGLGFAAALLVKWGRVRQMVYCNCKSFANLIAARR